MGTKEDLQSENERLGKEVAALRSLLAAVRDLADVPYPADPANSTDMQWHYMTCARRADSIAVYASPDMVIGGGPAPADWLHDRAASLRAEAARPLRYTPKAAEPVITDSERTCWRVNPETGAWCHRGGDHGVHRDSNGDEWRTDLSGKGVVLIGPFGNPPHRATDDEHPCSSLDRRSGSICRAQQGHDGPDHVGYGLDGREFHRWPTTADGPGGVLLPAACDPDNAPAKCRSCGIEAATEGDFCEACAPLALLATGSLDAETADGTENR